MLGKKQFLLACLTGSAMLLLAACDGDATDDDTEENGEEVAVPVDVTRPIRGDIFSTYQGTAPIEAFESAAVIAKVGGEVREILAEEGDDVSAGQVLARLDGDRLRLQVQESAAQVQKLRREYERNVELKDRSLISAGDFEKIQYEMEALQASYELASLELSYTEIRAPISGVVSERLIKLGNTIDVNSPAFQVTSLEPLVSYLFVPEREYQRLRANQAVSLGVDALPGISFSGKVARISPVVDPATGTFKITIEVSDATRRLKPGMFARISIISDMRPNVLQIPRNAIIDSDGARSVFIVRNKKAERREISVGYAYEGRVEVLEGLSDSDVIVVVGQNGLKDGSLVAIVDDGAGIDATDGI